MIKHTEEVKDAIRSLDIDTIVEAAGADGILHECQDWGSVLEDYSERVKLYLAEGDTAALGLLTYDIMMTYLEDIIVDAVAYKKVTDRCNVVSLVSNCGSRDPRDDD